MLDVEDLSVSYGAVRALQGVTFQAQDGSVTAVLGANGAGKTTLLRTVSGLVKQRSGTVSYDGEKLTGLSVENIVRLGISHVPEGRGVIEELTVDENLRLGTLWQFNRGHRRSVLDEIYDLFPPLAERRSRMASTLSGGERQMLAIGRALSSKPKLLLLDEPSLGLAPMVTAQIMAMVQRLARETRLTVVLVEQNVRSALSIAEEAVVINLGRVVVADRAATVAADTQLRHHYLGF
ncbi:MAG TPA: ABC transporter ATP-binding protein [Acidimicrobiales bacterium]|jgi:branched-chain amino acid transport system ATP-binding protein